MTQESVSAQFAGCCANCGNPFYAKQAIYIVNQTRDIQSGIHVDCKDEWNQHHKAEFQQVK